MTTDNTYVLDAFALIGFFKNEAGVAAKVHNLFRDADRGAVNLVAAVVNVAELYYKTVREFGKQRADEVLVEFQTYPVDIVPIDWPLAYAAAAIKGAFPISYADCIAAALTQRLDATLVTGDQGFSQIPDLTVEWLPAD